MFNKDFFPTPPEVIEQMLYGVDLHGKIVLEPSAGKGDIVDYCAGAGAATMLACEINPDLKKILHTKCKVIADDFLTVKSEDVSHIDLIVMNPPFSADEKHILHAWNIAPAGTGIIALCNYETYRNPHHRFRRELAAVIDANGSIEDLGACFADAERETKVNIALVKITKPGTQSADEFSGFFMDEEPEEAQSNGIMPYNFIRELVNRYVAAVRLFDEQMAVGVRMHNLTSTFFSGKYAFTCTLEGAPAMRNEFKKDLQKAAWDWVFEKMNMNKYATKGLKEDINKFVEKQSHVPFTMANIYKMIEIVIGTAGSRMDRALEEVFDKLTKYTKENRWSYEGWKTNSHYLVNRKFIMPYLCPQDRWNAGGTKIDIQFGRDRETLEDFVKALCYLTGRNYDNLSSLYSYIRENECRYGELYQWEFFEFRAYKKGTMHFRFLNEDVWATFNQHIARIKGYPLPESVRKQAA